ncbi:MAG: sodium-dependent transporter [Candidatus Hydrogenedentes bacterium]|nr:sodium-dependent transporter [Candidatus Hydrogenedentota bacterium]
MTHSTLRLDRWTTRYGLIMAMAGNAVGLGNFLRFPAKMEAYGGAFLIPYFVALLLLGLPLMWIEWTIGRHGGGHGHGSTPGMFHRLWPHPLAKYLGIFGVILPAAIGLYYVYIESWSLGYAWKTATGAYWGQDTREEMKSVFGSYLGLGDGFFSFGMEAYTFFLITIFLNLIVFSRGIMHGIELVAKYAMPVLLLLGAILAIRVLTLPAVDGRSAWDGLAYFFRIDWSSLASPDIWITATGQIFFTLSLGFGTIHTYASYLERHDDLVQNGLSTCAVNEFTEVILGSCVVVPAAVIFFGAPMTREIVAGGTFDIGFYTLPVIFQEFPFGRLFGTMWFALLFLAGLTSSVSMFTPLLLFLTEEVKMVRRHAITLVSVLVFVLMQPVILFMHRGVLDELDYWAGTFFLVVFGAVEAILFAWCFGMKKGWEELHAGSKMRVPGIYYRIMQFVTPALILVLLAWWTVDGMWATLTMAAVPEANKPYVFATRIGLLLCGAALAWAIHHAWKKNHSGAPAAD